MIKVRVPYPSVSGVRFGSAFHAALGQHGVPILADIPNHTNTQTTVQTSQVQL